MFIEVLKIILELTYIVNCISLLSKTDYLSLHSYL